MSRAQYLFEEALRIAHKEERISIFKIQDALKTVLKDVDKMIEDYKVEQKANSSQSKKNIRIEHQRESVFDISKLARSKM
jgi:hypothetical protein